MLKIDTLVSRYKEFIESCDAIREVDDRTITGTSEAYPSVRNWFHVAASLLYELAEEVGATVVDVDTPEGWEYKCIGFAREGITFFTLEHVNAAS